MNRSASVLLASCLVATNLHAQDDEEHQRRDVEIIRAAGEDFGLAQALEFWTSTAGTLNDDSREVGDSRMSLFRMIGEHDGVRVIVRSSSFTPRLHGFSGNPSRMAHGHRDGSSSGNEASLTLSHPGRLFSREAEAEYLFAVASTDDRQGDFTIQIEPCHALFMSLICVAGDQRELEFGILAWKDARGTTVARGEWVSASLDESSVVQGELAALHTTHVAVQPVMVAPGERRGELPSVEITVESDEFPPAVTVLCRNGFSVSRYHEANAGGESSVTIRPLILVDTDILVIVQSPAGGTGPYRIRVLVDG